MTKQDQIKRATAILNEAKNQEIIDDHLPEDDDTRIRLAEHIVKEARRARELGEKGDHVISILWIAEVDASGNYNSEPQDPDDESYNRILNESVEKGLSIPPEIEGEPPNLPSDLTQLSDKKVRQLYGAFNACSARTGWLYAFEEAGESAAKHVADHYEDKYLTQADRKDIGGKPKAQAQLKAEAKEADVRIPKWRNREKAHSIRANRYKRLLEIYDNTCERLSREWTMRMNEREHN